MSEFQLRTPSLRLPRASRPSLGNFQLQLDPQFAAEIRGLSTSAPSQRLRGFFQRPDWRRLRQMELDRLLRQPPMTPTPAFTPGAGPSTARAADFGDFMGALMAVPAIRTGMNRVLDLALQPLRRAASNMSGAETALLITHAVVMGGALVTVVNLQDSPPPFPLDLVLNRNIPVPVVDGLSVQLRHRGGGASWSDIGGSGVSVRGGAQSAGGNFQGDFFITLDVTSWVPELR